MPVFCFRGRGKRSFTASHLTPKIFLLSKTSLVFKNERNSYQFKWTLSKQSLLYWCRQYFEIIWSCKIDFQEHYNYGSCLHKRSAVHYIKSLHEEYPVIVHRVNQRKSRNKNNLAGDVSIFINGITPINCLACKVDYIHAAADNSNNNSVLCLLCNRYSHKPCYREENITPGLAFICTLCFKKNTSQESSDTSRIDFQNSPISSQDSVKPTAASSANQSPSTAQSPTSPHQSIASPTLATPPLSRTQSTPRAIPPVTLSPQQTQSQSATQSDSQDDRHDDSISSEDSMLNPYQTPTQS